MDDVEKTAIPDAAVDAALLAYWAAYPDGTSKAGAQGMRAAIQAALAAMGGEAEQKPLGLAYRFDPSVRWHLVEYEDQVPSRRDFPLIEVVPVFAHPPRSAVEEAVKAERERCIKVLIDAAATYREANQKLDGKGWRGDVLAAAAEAAEGFASLIRQGKGE